MVVLFHFDIPPFSGGFAGVDIFFVISGLLMTQIIEKGLERGNFSLGGFYGARVRRIVPAITICCLSIILWGTVMMDPLTLEETARNAVATMLFYSNILYALQGSYFSDAAEANWLLHSWTLSVEWQFYILYPIVLMLAARWRWLWDRRAPVALISCILLFVASQIVADLSFRMRDAAFYMLPTRAWEMLAGGCLAFYRPAIVSPKWARLLAGAGFAVILLSLVLLTGDQPWPSWWMLAPVGGTLALLAANRQDSFWLRLPGMQTTGAWSYSLYLWHWPVVAGFSYYAVQRTPLTLLGAIALCFVLAGLSYHLVETKLRDRMFGTARTTNAPRWIAIGTGWAALVALVLSASLTNGYFTARSGDLPAPARAGLADYQQAIGDWKAMDPCKPHGFGTGKACVIGKGQPERVLLIGDSHAEQMIPRLIATAPGQGLEVTLVRLQGCPPLPSLHWTLNRSACADFARKSFALARDGHFRRVVVFAAWGVYFSEAPRDIMPHRFCEPRWYGCASLRTGAQAWQAIGRGFAGLADELRAIREAGVETVLVLPQPSPATGAPRERYTSLFFEGKDTAPRTFPASEFLDRTAHVRSLLAAAARVSGSRLVDPVPVQCEGGICQRFHDGHYLFKDAHHIRASQAEAASFRWFDQALSGR